MSEQTSTIYRATVGAGKAVHVVNGHINETGCGRKADKSTAVQGETTCKACKRTGLNAQVKAGNTRWEDITPTLFEVETEAPSNSEDAAPVEDFSLPVLVPGEPVDNEQAPELEGPSERELYRIARREELDAITTGYSVDQWIDVMLSLDTHTVGMSDGIAAERLFIARHEAKQARKQASQQARAERDIENIFAADGMFLARAGATYAAMTRLTAAIGTRRAMVQTLTGKTVTVQCPKWVKGEGDTLETVATWTLVKGVYSVKRPGVKGTEKHTEEFMVQFLLDSLTERSADLMPRRFRHVMRTHRAKNTAPTDITGNRAARAVDGVEEASLSRLDLTDYAATLDDRAAGIAVRTTGKKSMQGVKLTESERRASDRERLRLWRAARRAEKLAASMADFIPAKEA